MSRILLPARRLDPASVRTAALIAACLGAAAPLVWLTIRTPILGFGILYVISFWVFAWYKPQVALMMIVAFTPLQNDISGGGAAKFSLAELNMVLTLPLFYLHLVTRKQKLSLGPIGVPVFFYLCICGLSSYQHWLGGVAINSLLQMFLYMVLAALLFSHLVTRPEQNLLCLNALVVSGVLLALYKLSGNNFLQIHKNGMGGSLSCILIVCLELWFATTDKKRKVLLLLALMLIGAGLIFTLSRGSWLGAIVGVLAIFLLRRQFKLLLQTSLLLLPIIAVCWSLLPQADREYATDFKRKQDNGGANIELRYESVDIAMNYWKQNPVLGSGVGLRKNYDATNTPLMILAETGVLGLLAFTLVYVAFLRMAWTTQRFLSRDDPRYSFLAVGSGLMLGHMAHGMVDHYWARGPAAVAWCSAGMALGVYLSVQQSRLRGETAS